MMTDFLPILNAVSDIGAIGGIVVIVLLLTRQNRGSNGSLSAYIAQSNITQQQIGDSLQELVKLTKQHMSISRRNGTRLSAIEKKVNFAVKRQLTKNDIAKLKTTKK